MTRVVRAGAAQWARFLAFSAVLATLVFACVSKPLTPIPGVRDAERIGLVAVPGGHVNAAGGNFVHERTDLRLDTRLGPFALGAFYNSSWGWTWSLDLSYRNGTLRDETGASHALASLADGAPVIGTHWVKVDAARVKAKGGLLHEFDPATGRLVAVRFTTAAYPRLRFVQAQLGSLWRTASVEQCVSSSACATLLALEYDASARLVEARDLAGRVARFAYDAAGRLVGARDAADLASGRAGERYEYAGAYLSAIASSDGERVEITSDGDGRALSVRAVGAGDPTWSFGYATVNAAGHYLTTARDPLGHATVLAFDAARALRSVTNALGEVTRYGWAAGRLASIERPDGTRTTFTVVDDDVVSEVQPSGNVVTTTYFAGGVDRENPRARPIASRSDSLGAIERRTYDAAGRLVTIANGLGETTIYAYAADETLQSARTADGNTTYFDLTGAHGHAARLSLGGRAWATAVYDSVGNPLGASWPSPGTGGVQTFQFDADRNVAAMVLRDAPAGGAAPSTQTLTIERRADGRPLRVLRPYGGETRFRYDALGRLIALAELASDGEAPDPAAFRETRFEYDLLGRQTAQERANGMREEIVYDVAGRAARRRALRGGVVEADIVFEYAAGRLVRARDAARGFEEIYAYDSAGRVSEVTHSLGERTRLAYDLRSRPIRTELVLPSGDSLAALTHGYDLADRETRLTYLAADLVARTYTGGRLTETRYGNGLRRLQFRDASAGRTAGRELWRGGTRLEKSDYTLRAVLGGEAARLRTELAGSAATQEDFSYASSVATPGMDRRVSATVSAIGAASSTESVAYDHLSNATHVDRAISLASQTVVTSAALVFNAEHNRVLRVDSGGSSGFDGAFVYDAAGFVTEQSSAVGARSSTRFDWNARGQIAAISTDGAVEATFAYDALGRRRERYANGALRRWRFGGLVEADGSDQPVAIDLGEVRIQLDGQHRFRHADWRGNTKLVSDAAGQIETHNAFGAYGWLAALGERSRDSVFARGDSVETSNGELLLLGARLYTPAFGRFLSPDPVWNPVNLYSYTLGNPVDFWDVSGLHSGSHHDLYQAQLAVGATLFVAAGTALALVTLPVTAPAGAVTLAAIGLAGSLFAFANALIELDQQTDLHRDLTRAERERSGHDLGIRGGGGIYVGPGSGGLGGEGGHGPTEVVCNDAGSGWDCTRTPSGSGGGTLDYWIY